MSAVELIVGLGLTAALWSLTILFLKNRRLDAQLREQSARLEQTQSDLEILRTQMEERVQERTAVLEARNNELIANRIELQRSNERLSHLAIVDGLTGIANRRHFDDVMGREVRRCLRERQPLSLILVDIDGFKRYNDTYGHSRGDETLRRVAQAVQRTFRRAGDLAARYGGEEFAIVLPGIDPKRAWLFADRLRRNIWRLTIPNSVSKVADRVTISAGVATALPGRAYDADELIRAADSALYRAKGGGRNRVEAHAAIAGPDDVAAKAG